MNQDVLSSILKALPAADRYVLLAVPPSAAWFNVAYDTLPREVFIGHSLASLSNKAAAATCGDDAPVRRVTVYASAPAVFEFWDFWERVCARIDWCAACAQTLEIRSDAAAEDGDIPMDMLLSVWRPCDPGERIVLRGVTVTYRMLRAILEARPHLGALEMVACCESHCIGEHRQELMDLVGSHEGLRGVAADFPFAVFHDEIMLLNTRPFAMYRVATASAALTRLQLDNIPDENGLYAALATHLSAMSALEDLALAFAGGGDVGPLLSAASRCMPALRTLRVRGRRAAFGTRLVVEALQEHDVQVFARVRRLDLRNVTFDETSTASIVRVLERADTLPLEEFLTPGVDFAPLRRAVAAAPLTRVVWRRSPSWRSIETLVRRVDAAPPGTPDTVDAPLVGAAVLARSPRLRAVSLPPCVELPDPADGGVGGFLYQYRMDAMADAAAARVVELHVECTAAQRRHFETLAPRAFPRLRSLVLHRADDAADLVPKIHRFADRLCRVDAAGMTVDQPELLVLLQMPRLEELVCGHILDETALMVPIADTVRDSALRRLVLAPFNRDPAAQLARAIDIVDTGSARTDRPLDVTVDAYMPSSDALLRELARHQLHRRNPGAGIGHLRLPKTALENGLFRPGAVRGVHLPNGVSLHL